MEEFTMSFKNYIFVFSVLFVSCCTTETALGKAVNHTIVKQDTFVIDEPLVNNGDIEVKTLLVDADFKNNFGFIKADDVLVTASCDTFENLNVLEVADTMTFADPETHIIFSHMTRVNALYKGDDYMGGIDCWFGKKNVGTLTITNKDKKYVFEGSVSTVKEVLNKGLNKAANVTALIAYVRQYLTKQNLVAAALRR